MMHRLMTSSSESGLAGRHILDKPTMKKTTRSIAPEWSVLAKEMMLSDSPMCHKELSPIFSDTARS